MRRAIKALRYVLVSAVEIAGAVSITYGLLLVYRPLAFIVGGIGMAAFAYLADR